MKFPSLRLAAGIIASIAITACTSDSPVDVEQTQLTRSDAAQAAAPATLAWQARTRTLIGGANASPLAAGRILAAVAVAQHRAVSAVTQQADEDGTLPSDGFGAGGRSRYEAQRAAV